MVVVIGFVLGTTGMMNKQRTITAALHVPRFRSLAEGLKEPIGSELGCEGLIKGGIHFLDP